MSRYGLNLRLSPQHTLLSGFVSFSYAVIVSFGRRTATPDPLMNSLTQNVLEPTSRWWEAVYEAMVLLEPMSTTSTSAVTSCSTLLHIV